MPVNATKHMDAENLPLGKKFAYWAEDSLAAAGNGTAILIPPDVSNITLTVTVAGGGQGKVQATTDPVGTVKTGTPTWLDWAKGVVSANTQDSALPVSALRLVQSSVGGTTALTVRAQ